MKIYLVQAENTNLYKIGVSNNVEKRLLSLQTGNGNKIILKETFETKFNQKLERALHRHYKQYKKEGEWFELEPIHLSEFINVCKKKEEQLEFLIEENSYIQDKKNF